MDGFREDCPADKLRPDERPRHWWAWMLALALGIAAVAAAFVGYGQPELLLDAVNLRYCG
ncbi:MAG: hypothetical protein KJ787_02815 [Gammaproteobacteria bacterium]|nr:hypothetical protein [Gammaproteobacteria bacterium]MBU1645247.1 hypothetical protein [Gammaproteobacteria bacterium]MBU1971584.1 hypothetical protein [Gammaproteobacteria bacterium]